MSRIKEFALGLSYVGKGFRFFFNHRKLWPYAVIPTLINLIVLVLLIFALIHYFSDISTWIFGTARTEIHTGIISKILGTTLDVLIFIAKLIIFLVLFIFLFVTTYVISMIISAPFNDLLSEKVEEIVSAQPAPAFSMNRFARSLKRTIFVETQKAVFFITIPLFLLILNLLPVLGSLIYLIIANLFASFAIGFNFLDYPMSRKLWTFTNSLRFAWSKKYLVSGFGIVVLIPLFPYIFSSPLVTGGTILFVEKISTPIACQQDQQSEKSQQS